MNYNLSWSKIYSRWTTAVLTIWQ